MRTLIAVLAGASVLSVLAMGILTSPTARAQDGEPDISGNWTGKAKGKRSPLDPGGESGKSGGEFGMTITQVGPDVEIVLDRGNGDPVVTLTGKIGNGHLWAASADTENPLVVVGHIKKGTKWKGTAIEAGSAYSIELKLSAKKAVAK